MKNRAEIRLELKDTQWPFTYTDHDRAIARAIVVDDEGNYYFVRARRDDEFGHVTLIETSGGGVEPGEALEVAIRRELREELGTEVEILGPIGVVSDYYNLIHRHNVNHYFLCRARSFGERHLLEDEINMFHLEPLKLSYPEAVGEYEKRAETPLGRLIRDRELPVLRRARALLTRDRDLRVWCFGDSNTWGFDPRVGSGGRVQKPWTNILAARTGFNVVNDGQNGRKIPLRPEEWTPQTADFMLIMLGTNDLLTGATAKETAARMAAFLDQCPAIDRVLIAPPVLRRGAWVPGDELVEESRKLAGEYRKLAQRLNIRFLDSGEWDIPVVFDGVHFTENGHARFAEKLAQALGRWEDEA